MRIAKRFPLTVYYASYWLPVRAIFTLKSHSLLGLKQYKSLQTTKQHKKPGAILCIHVLWTHFGCKNTIDLFILVFDQWYTGQFSIQSIHLFGCNASGQPTHFALEPINSSIKGLAFQKIFTHHFMWGSLSQKDLKVLVLRFLFPFFFC